MWLGVWTARGIRKPDREQVEPEKYFTKLDSYYWKGCQVIDCHYGKGNEIY